MTKRKTLILLVLAIALPVLVILVSQRVLLRSKAVISSTPVVLSLPQTLRAKAGETISVPITLNTGTTNIYGVDVQLIYNPDYVRVIDIVPNTAQLKTFMPAVNNVLNETQALSKPGIVEFGAMTLTPSQSTTPASFIPLNTNNTSTTVATLNVQLLKQGKTQLAFVHNNPASPTVDTNVLSLNTGKFTDVLSQIQNSEIQIDAGTIAPPPPAAATSIRGSFDTANCSQIWGWAQAMPGSLGGVKVRILSDNVQVGLVDANKLRSDVGGNFGFALSTTTYPQLFDGKPHRIQGQAVYGSLLYTLPDYLGPQTITCSPHIQGAFDVASCTQISGWAKVIPYNVGGTKVQVLSDGVLVGTVDASAYRSDLRGNYGFVVSTGAFPKLFDGKQHKIQVRPTYNTLSTLLGPKYITCGSSPVQ